MARLAERLEKIPDLLREKIERYRVPGAALAVLDGDEIFETAAGVVNADTRVEATPDAVFQIGSITKLFTATLILQLIDEGRVELDAPVRTYLPEFELGSAEAAAAITVRQLLCHSSGIDGDFFQDAGRGDDCVERYVLACSGLGQLHEPGALFSYCNAGFVIAGRIVEKLRGMTWDAALARYVLEPIGARTFDTLPEQALYRRAAVGHLPDPDTRELRPAHVPFLPRSSGPAGATPFAAPRDLLQFARLHLSGGVTQAGERVLSAAGVAKMQKFQVAVPESRMANAWGLGWMLFDWSGTRVIGHDGGTIGQSAYFRVVPERGIAVALLTNGGNTAALYRRIFDAVLEELAGITLPPLPEPAAVALEPARYVGKYERLAGRLIVEERDGRLWLRSVDRRPLFPAQAEPAPAVELHPVSDSLFRWSAPESGFKNYGTFLDFASDGRPAFLHVGGRAAPRVR